MLSIQDLDIKGKTVFLRCDINSPIDPDSLKILDHSRLLEVAETIDALKDSKLIVASHQGRLGKSDYVSMEQHAPVLSKLLNRKFCSRCFWTYCNKYNKESQDRRHIIIRQSKIYSRRKCRNVT